MLPALQPTMASMGILAFSNSSKTPKCESPRAPPPPKTKASRTSVQGAHSGTGQGCSGSSNRVSHPLALKPITAKNNKYLKG